MNIVRLNDWWVSSFKIKFEEPHSLFSSETIQELASAYFNFGTLTAVIPQGRPEHRTREGRMGVVRLERQEAHPLEFLLTTIKIISYATLVIPALVACIWFFSSLEDEPVNRHNDNRSEFPKEVIDSPDDFKGYCLRNPSVEQITLAASKKYNCLMHWIKTPDVALSLIDGMDTKELSLEAQNVGGWWTLARLFHMLGAAKVSITGLTPLSEAIYMNAPKEVVTALLRKGVKDNLAERRNLAVRYRRADIVQAIDKEIERRKMLSFILGCVQTRNKEAPIQRSFARSKIYDRNVLGIIDRFAFDRR